MFARSPVSERSSRFRTSAACITVTNVRPLNAMPADAFLANDKGCRDEQCGANQTTGRLEDRLVTHFAPPKRGIRLVGILSHRRAVLGCGCHSLSCRLRKTNRNALPHVLIVYSVCAEPIISRPTCTATFRRRCGRNPACARRTSAATGRNEWQG